MKEILKPIPILSCIVVLLLLISISKTKYINSLECTVDDLNLKLTDIHINEIDSAYIITLQNEIMEIGSELDSMKLKYD